VKESDAETKKTPVEKSFAEDEKVSVSVESAKPSQQDDVPDCGPLAVVRSILTKFKRGGKDPSDGKGGEDSEKEEPPPKTVIESAAVHFVWDVLNKLRSLDQVL